MAGFYSELFLTNTSGMHTFDAAVLTLLGDLGALDKPGFQHPDGTVIDLIDTKKGNKVELADLLVHRNGRVGLKDYTKDTLVVPINKLAQLPELIQNKIYSYEQVPGGRRPPRAGSEVIPPR